MRSESVKLLVKNYPKDHQTMSNKEIADKYGVTIRTVYFLLEEISKNMGVSRESLLDYPHSKHKSRGANPKKELVDPKEFSHTFENIRNNISEVIAKIDKEIKK